MSIDHNFFHCDLKLNLKQGITREMMIEDETGKPLEAQKVFTESIKYLKGHFQKTINKQGKTFKDSEILFVLTVPAIW